MQKVPKILDPPVLQRVLSSLMERMKPEDQSMFCKAITKSMETLKLQLSDFNELGWWNASKRRSDGLRHLEKEKTVCQLLKAGEE